jgi:hypothetical protein
LPSAGHLIIARFCFSIFSATCFDGASTFASVQQLLRLVLVEARELRPGRGR